MWTRLVIFYARYGADGPKSPGLCKSIFIETPCRKLQNIRSSERVIRGHCYGVQELFSKSQGFKQVAFPSLLNPAHSPQDPDRKMREFSTLQGKVMCDIEAPCSKLQGIFDPQGSILF